MFTVEIAHSVPTLATISYTNGTFTLLVNGDTGASGRARKVNDLPANPQELAQGLPAPTRGSAPTARQSAQDARAGDPTCAED